MHTRLFRQPGLLLPFAMQKRFGWQLFLLIAKRQNN